MYHVAEEWINEVTILLTKVDIVGIKRIKSRMRMFLSRQLSSLV